MRKDDQNPVVRVTESVKEMLALITAFQIGGVSVVGPDRRLLGLVTDYDVRRALVSGRDVLSMTIEEIMNPTPEWIQETVKAVNALEIMRHRSKPIALLPVLNHDRVVVGMIHLHDLISAGL
jgi:arabinose-5-phosphate isomerase